MLIGEIVSIGNELLQGRMDDTNSTHISRRLLDLGVKVLWRSTCGDAPADIKETLRAASQRADIVVCTGGLGPTVDDTTTEAVAELLGVRAVVHPEVEKHVRDFYKMVNMPVKENGLRQALVPEGADIIMNPAGLAPCILVKHGRADMAFFPGVPREMTAMLDAALARMLAGRGAGTALSRTIKVFGVGESNLENMIPKDITTCGNPSFSFLPVDFEVHLRMTARAETKERCEEMLEAPVARLYECVGKHVFAEGDDTMESVTLKELQRKGLTLACAESLTGGMVAARIVNVAGASKTLLGGVVAYNDEVKAGVLGVSGPTLSEYGAVSEQCAMEMAQGAIEKFGADVAVSTTGNAGPEAQSGAPVGRVCVAVAFADGRPPVSASRDFIRNRNAVRLMSTLFALDFLRRNI